MVDIIHCVTPFYYYLSTTCNVCLGSSLVEENHDIIPLPMSSSIIKSFSKFVAPEELSSENIWFCPYCNKQTPSTREVSIKSCGPVLIVQLNRFSTFQGKVTKDDSFFQCLPPATGLKIPITREDEVSFSDKYSLVATINHSGTLDRVHYWAFIFDSSNKHWFNCNDRVIFKTDQKSINNNSCYILFYKRN